MMNERYLENLAWIMVSGLFIVKLTVSVSVLVWKMSFKCIYPCQMNEIGFVERLPFLE